MSARRWWGVAVCCAPLHARWGFWVYVQNLTAILHHVMFGCWCTLNNKKWLHYHLGEGFSSNWAINKCCHMCFGQRFMWVTDCYAIKFILSYNRQHPLNLQLQMQFCRKPFAQPRSSTTRKERAVFRWKKVTIWKLIKEVCYEHQIWFYEMLTKSRMRVI